MLRDAGAFIPKLRRIVCRNVAPLRWQSANVLYVEANGVAEDVDGAKSRVYLAYAIDIADPKHPSCKFVTGQAQR